MESFRSLDGSLKEEVSMFDLSFALVGAFFKNGGSGLGSILNTLFLLLIWLSARGLKKEVQLLNKALDLLKETLTKLQTGHEVRLGNLETRVNKLEGVDK